ncbi:efflux RND transporter periplasmic adaptor subunit [Rhizorhabdus dicambivorans]|uniref:Efflux RND transporter periplasmic adaptor subunit n=1 Tax=Rhizorhabdus dicambivorans TaxID=1850238 RepID=A0A2A4FSW5_9SPHN|nr:efflux RND transporter periplasmic adaptor subunit [Rhizorhabdus dicambivorans]ATE64779.1 efflux RND transporter periplasmic adaptor subunit [Rhizorhabdus dicambivorans]PCE41277.1 efflux RND transporter periplasmic adaptor subunit [Rhizorhabdus dicambivorans]
MYLSDLQADTAQPLDSGQPEAQPRFTRKRAAYAALPIAGLLLFGAYGLIGGDKAQADTQPLPTVTVAQPIEKSIVEWDDYVGRFEASQAVEIRPRVSGALTAIHFKDGQIVHKGQLLFTIDPRPFAASLAEARARAASAVTALALARADLARANRLIADQAVSAEEVDSLRARVQSAEAAVAAARAQVQARRLDVEFTQVRAPITGRVSDRRADIGNLVSGDSAASATVLTTINALDPIYFAFDGSEALYLKQRRQKAGSDHVEIRLQDEADYKWKGKVDFTDNALNDGSGTIRGRAVIRNPDYFLTPGLFGNMRLAAGGARNALLVPDGAVVTDQARKIVYVIKGKDGAVEARPVEAGALIGGLRVIRSGLTPRDRVVISGVQFAATAPKVQTIAGRIEAAPAAAPVRSVSAPAASQATFAAAR